MTVLNAAPFARKLAHDGTSQKEGVMAGVKKFQLKAGKHWAVLLYKGKPRVVMNRDLCAVRQPIAPYDVLSIARVRELAAWLNRYLNEVAPTEVSTLLAAARVNTRGIERNLTTLEAKQKL